jgi:GrpB-like predicted nucleotidyltransferase (UPF0157 family)
MPVAISAYQTIWKDHFHKLSTLFQELLSTYPIEMHHVGSTSITGLWAKPILDIDIVIQDKSLLNAIITKLEKAGYEFRGDQGVPGRLAFKQTSLQVPFTKDNFIWQEHHLYVCFADALALKNHLLFKEALLNNPTLIDQYNQLKRSLVDDPSMTREIYTKRKTTFILSVLANCGLTEQEIKEIESANI